MSEQWIADQVGAASRDANAAIDEIVKGGGWAKTGRRSHSAKLWATRITVERMVGMLTGELRTCPHLGSPRPCLAPVWADIVVCLDCTHLIPDYGEVENRTCDRCRQTVESGSMIYPSAVQTGPLIVLVGLCEACKRLTQSEAP